MRRRCKHDVPVLCPHEIGMQRRILPMFRREGRGGSFRPREFALYGLSGFSAQNFYETQNPGGEAGVNTGFVSVLVFRARSFPTATQTVSGRAGASAGWRKNFYTTGATQFFAANGGGALTNAGAGYLLAPSDVGKILVWMGWYTGANQVRQALSRFNASYTAGCVGYTPHSGQQLLGAGPAGAEPATTVDILGELTLRGTPSDADLIALFDVIRASGDVPHSVAGATVTHRWSARDVLRGAPNPAGRKVYGLRGWSSTATLTSASTSTGIRGGATMWVACHLVFSSVSIGTQGIVTVSDNGGQGWQIYAATSALGATVRDGTSNKVAQSAAGVLETGRPILALLNYDGTKVDVWARGAVVATIAASGFTAWPQTMRVGNRADLGIPATGAHIFGIQGADGAFLTNGEVAQLFADFERDGKMPTHAKAAHYWDFDRDIRPSLTVPATSTDRVGADTLTAAGTLEVAADVATGPAAPTSIADSITAASADTMSRVGAPTVAVIDPSIDGRKSYGALGFAATTYLETGGGVRGGSASGMWIAVLCELGSLSGNEALVSAINGTSGWDLVKFGATLLCGRRISGSYTSTNPYTFTAADLNRPVLLGFSHTGSQLRTVVEGALQGADHGAAGMGAAATPMQVGLEQSSIYPATTTRIYGVVGGDGSYPTAAEWAQLAADTKATGRIGTIPGKTTHHWDLTRDVEANAGPANGLPAQVLDRVGTDHLTRVGVDVRSGPNSIRGIGPYSTVDYWSTVAGGGIAGAAGGFHIVADVVFTSLPGTGSIGGNNPSPGTQGFRLFTQSGGIRFALLISGVATFASIYTVLSGDLNTRLRVVANFTATGQLQLWINGVQVGSDVAVGSTYVAPSGGQFMVGLHTGNVQPFSEGFIELVESGNFPLTSGEIATLNADLTSPAPVVAGKTQRRWRLEQDIAAVNGGLPTRSVERVSGGDDLIRAGAPLQVAQRVDRVWSYETNPILYGASGLSSANYWSLAGGFAGDPLGFMVEVLLKLESQAVASAFRYVAAKRDNTSNAPGWSLYTLGTNSQFAFVAGNGTTASAAPTSTINASDVGKLLLLTGVWDAASGKVRMYIKRAEAGTGTSLASYAAHSAAFTLGRRSDGFPSDGITVYGFRAGNFAPVLAEVQATHDAVMGNERMSASDYPGRPHAHLYRFDGAALPSPLTDLVGSAHLTLNGTPTIAPQYARAWGW